MYDRNEYMRERMKELHKKRHAMGLCIYCSCMIDNPKYKLCAACRDKSRIANAKYRETLKEQKKNDKPKPLFTEDEDDEPRVPADHKCWTCEWSRFEGDRFFCPFIEGTCVKEDKE